MPAAGTAAAPPPPRNTHRRAPARRRIRINQHGRKQKRSKRETYHRVLVYFMRYRDQIEYKFGHQFTQEQLMSITPTDLIKYFKYHCYGNPDADTDIECPQHRSAKVPLVCDGVDAELLMEPLECTKTIFCQSRFCLATMQPKVMENIGSSCHASARNTDAHCASTAATSRSSRFEGRRGAET